jgi:putative transposase
VRQAYWQALDGATGARDAKQRLQALVGELDNAGYTRRGQMPGRRPGRARRSPALPTRHRRRWRSTNPLERSLGEVKRRTKVIGRFPGETSCLTLVWAVLDLYITHATNGVRFTQLRTATPTPHEIRRPRTNHPRGGDRRIDRPPPGTRAAAK